MLLEATELSDCSKEHRSCRVAAYKTVMSGNGEAQLRPVSDVVRHCCFVAVRMEARCQ